MHLLTCSAVHFFVNSVPFTELVAFATLKRAGFGEQHRVRRGRWGAGGEAGVAPERIAG
jgi:hypothetical protein